MDALPQLSCKRRRELDISRVTVRKLLTTLNNMMRTGVRWDTTIATF